MIRSRNRNAPPPTGLDLLERDRKAANSTTTAMKFGKPRSAKIMCSRGTRKLRFGGRGQFKPGGRLS